MAVLKAAAAALLALLLAAPVLAEDPPATELVDSLLAMLGFAETTPADLQREIASIGGIPFREDVPLAYLTRAELAAYLKDLFDTEYPAERARADERLLRAFGMLPPGTDLRALRTRLLLENVAGFYDERPARRRLYAVSDEARLTPGNQLVMSHELRHALQDQYADVHRLLPPSVGDYDDRRMAMMSLLEGDATLVMERFILARIPGAEGGDVALQELSVPAAAELLAPPVVRDQLVLPYVIGRTLARAIFHQGGWDAIRAAWSSPPASTEQVLHPEKYLAREDPRPVTIPWAPPGGTLLAEGVLGEVFTRSLLGDGSEAAAAGWGGDRYRAWDVRGRTLLVWRSVWDSSRDHDEMLAAARATFAKRYASTGARSGVSRFRGDGFDYAWSARDGAVTLVSSDERRLLERALEALRRP